MCFTVNFNYNKRLIADRDIPCWKVFDNSEWISPKIGTGIGGYRSEHRGFEYLFGEVYTCKLQEPFMGTIDYGFHSFMDYNRAKRYAGTCQSVVLAYILKGSEYYVNPTVGNGQYCSNSLFIVNRINDKANFTLWEKFIFWLENFEWFFTH